VGGYTDMPGTTAGGIPFFGSESARPCLCRKNRIPGLLLEHWNEVSTKKSWIGEIEIGARTDLVTQ